MCRYPAAASCGTIRGVFRVHAKIVVQPSAAKAFASARQRRTWPPPISAEASARKTATRGDEPLPSQQNIIRLPAVFLIAGRSLRRRRRERLPIADLRQPRLRHAGLVDVVADVVLGPPLTGGIAFPDRRIA